MANNRKRNEELSYHLFDEQGRYYVEFYNVRGNERFLISDPNANGNMVSSTYDPTGVNQQLVGITAAQSLTNKTVNGVVLTNTGSATQFLNAQGNYVTVSGGGVSVSNQGNNRLITATSTTDALNAESELTYSNGNLTVNSTNAAITAFSSSNTGSTSVSSQAGSNLSLQNFGSSFAGTVAGQARASLGLIQNNTNRLMLLTVGAHDMYFGVNNTLSANIIAGTRNWNFNNNDLENINEIYLGDRDTNGSWRFTTSGDDLLIQQREAGVYNTKSTISGA